MFKKLAFEIGSENWTLEFDLGKLELYFQQLHSKCRMEIQTYPLVVENWGPKFGSKIGPNLGFKNAKITYKTCNKFE